MWAKGCLPDRLLWWWAAPAGFHCVLLGAVRGWVRCARLRMVALCRCSPLGGVVGCVGLCWWQLVVGSGWWRVGRPVGGDGGAGFQAGLLVLHRWVLRSRTSGVRVHDSGDGWGRGPASTAFCSAPVHDCCGWVRCAQLRMATACRYSPSGWCCWEGRLRLVRPEFRVGGRTSCR